MAMARLQVRFSHKWCNKGIRAIPNVHGTAFRRFIPSRYIVRAYGSSDEGEELGDLFKQELARRNIGSVDDIQDEDASASGQGKQSGQGRRPVAAPPKFSEDFQTPPQLEKSRQLNSEGLEGLPARATALLRLGTSFFLSFGPFIAAVILSFAAIYFIFGDAFLHSGRPSVSSPVLYDPDELLNSPTVDPMVPL